MKTLAFDLHGTLAYVEAPSQRIADGEALQALRGTYQFALVTGCERREAYEALRETGLAPLFEEKLIILAEDYGEKSGGGPFIELRRRVGEAVVMVGDQDADVAGAALAGIPCVRVRACTSLAEQQSALREGIAEAVRILESMRELR